MTPPANPYLTRKLELQRLAQGRKLVLDQLAAIDQQIRQRAENQAIAYVGGKTYCFGRSSTSWRPPHERAFRAIVANLRDRRGREIGALQRKVERQTAAIEAYRRRHGLNIDAAELLGRNLSFEIEGD